MDAVSTPNLESVARCLTSRIRDTLQNDVPGAREALKQILDGPISFKLNGSDYRIEGKTRVGAVFSPDSTATSIKMASPRGFEPLSPP